MLVVRAGQTESRNIPLKNAKDGKEIHTLREKVGKGESIKSRKGLGYDVKKSNARPNNRE